MHKPDPLRALESPAGKLHVKERSPLLSGAAESGTWVQKQLRADRLLVRFGYLLFGGAVLGMGLSACGKNKSPLPGDDQVLAQVEGQKITAWDLEHQIDQSLGPFAVPSVERGMRSKALDSLVEGRALAILAEKSLKEGERAELEKRVAAYRESLLIKDYVARHGGVKRPDEAALLKYYEEHPALFGANEVKRYELLGTREVLEGEGRVQAVKRLSALGFNSKFPEIVAELEKAGLPLSYSEGDVSSSALDEKLKEALGRLQVGQTTGVSFVRGRAFVGKVVGTRKLPPRPFAEVRSQVQKTLETVALRDALRALGEKALAQVKVQRTELAAGAVDKEGSQK